MLHFHPPGNSLNKAHWNLNNHVLEELIMGLSWLFSLERRRDRSERSGLYFFLKLQSFPPSKAIMAFCQSIIWLDITRIIRWLKWMHHISWLLEFLPLTKKHSLEDHFCFSFRSILHAWVPSLGLAPCSLLDTLVQNFPWEAAQFAFLHRFELCCIKGTSAFVPENVPPLLGFCAKPPKASMHQMISKT